MTQTITRVVRLDDDTQMLLRELVEIGKVFRNLVLEMELLIADSTRLILEDDAGWELAE